MQSGEKETGFLTGAAKVQDHVPEEAIGVSGAGPVPEMIHRPLNETSQPVDARRLLPHAY